MTSTSTVLSMTSLQPLPGADLRVSPLSDAVPPNTPDADATLPPPTLAHHWFDRSLVQGVLESRKPLIAMDGAGLGTWFDQVLGGGIQPGEVMAIGSAGAGVGKTAFVHQMADGWAKASAAALANGDGTRRPKVTPVIYVTEMAVRALTIRTLAREGEVPGRILRAPAHFPFEAPQAFDRATRAASAFRDAAQFITPIDRSVAVGHGQSAVQTLGHYAERIRDQWSKSADVQAIVLAVDPLHRLLAPDMDETSGLTEILGAVLAETQARDLVTIFTSDTTKSAAGARNNGSGDSAPDLEQSAEQAFRGNYQLLHIPDHVLAVRTLDPEKAAHEALFAPFREAYKTRLGVQPAEWATVFADLPTPKLRWGKVGDRPAFWFDRALFRFTPMERPAKHTTMPTRREGRVID